jgi:hypothetical protein
MSSKSDAGTGQQWYIPEPSALATTGRELLKRYCSIPEEDVLPHVLKIVNVLG